MKGLIAVLAAAMTLTALPVTAPAFGADAAQWTDLEDAVLLVDGGTEAEGKGHNGFRRSCTWLTQAQLDGISSEETADAFFEAETEDSFLGGTAESDWIVYSALTREEKGGFGFRRLESGLSLAAMREVLGCSTTDRVFFRARDGWPKSSQEISGGSGGASGGLWVRRYTFASEDAPEDSGTEVKPAVALTGSRLTRDGLVDEDESTLETPLLVLGQLTAGDYNAQYMGRNLREIDFGATPTVLTIDDNGMAEDLTAGQVICGTAAGASIDRQQLTCTVTAGGSEHTLSAAGVKLSELLDNAGVSTENSICTAAAATGSDAETQSLDTEELERYFVADEAGFDGKPLTAGSAAMRTLTQSDGADLLLLSPRNDGTYTAAPLRTLKVVRMELPAPAGAKAARVDYRSLKVSWKRTAGAGCYRIDRYNGRTGRWKQVKILNGVDTVKWTDRGLETGTSYRYRITPGRDSSGSRMWGRSAVTAAVSPCLTRGCLTGCRKKSGRRTGLAWKKTAGASGYQVQRARSRNMKKGRRTMTLRGGRRTSWTSGRLKKGRTYYYRVRAWRTVAGKKVPGAYSTVRRVRFQGDE